MEKLLTDEIVAQLDELFAELEKPVTILFFSKEKECHHCEEIDRLAREVAAISDKIEFARHDLEAEGELAARYNVDKAPVLVLAAEKEGELFDYGVRYAGPPAGHEFTSLIHDILYVSRQKTDLSESTRQFLRGLERPIRLQVFVTPTCPYCPRAVVLAHQLAMESPLVQAEMVEATTFPELAARFGVSGVPQTTINDGAGTLVGAVPEAQLLAELQRVVSLN